MYSVDATIHVGTLLSRAVSYFRHGSELDEVEGSGVGSDLVPGVGAEVAPSQEIQTPPDGNEVVGPSKASYWLGESTESEMIISPRGNCKKYGLVSSCTGTATYLIRLLLHTGTGWQG